MAVWQVLEPSSQPDAETFDSDLLKRAGHTAVLVGSEILVLGGRKGPTFWSDCLSYDTKQGKWRTLLQGLPFPPRANHQAALVQGSYLWVFGGSDENTVHDDVYVLDVNTRQWTKPALWGKTHLLQRCAAAVDVHPSNPDILLMFGGYGLPTGTQPAQYSAFNDLVSINTKTYEVTVLQPGGKPPAPRCFHSFTTVGSRCWVVGGRAPQADKLQLPEMIGVYDAASNTWLETSVHDYQHPQAGSAPCQLSPRSSHKALAVQGQLLVTGGNSSSERHAGLHHNSLALWLRVLPTSSTARLQVAWEPVQATLNENASAHEPLGKLKAYLPEVLVLHLPESHPGTIVRTPPPQLKLKQPDAVHQTITPANRAQDVKHKEVQAGIAATKTPAGIQHGAVCLQPLLPAQQTKQGNVQHGKQQKGVKAGKRGHEEPEGHALDAQPGGGAAAGDGPASPGWIRKRRRADDAHSPERGHYIHTTSVQVTSLHAVDAAAGVVAREMPGHSPAAHVHSRQPNSAPNGKQAEGALQAQRVTEPEVIEILDHEPQHAKDMPSPPAAQQQQQQQQQQQEVRQAVQQQQLETTIQAKQQQLQRHDRQHSVHDGVAAARAKEQPQSVPVGYASEPPHSRLPMDVSTSMAQCMMLSELRAELSINKEARRVAEAARAEEAARLQRAEQALAAKDAELQHVRAMLQEAQAQSNNSVVQLVQKQTAWMAEKQQLQEQHGAVHSRCREVEATLAARQQELDVSRAETHKLSQQLQAIAAERDQLQQMQAHAHVQLDQLQAAHNRIAAELARCKDEAKAQQQELATEQERCREAQQRVVELVALVESAKADLLEANKARSSLSDQVATLQANAAEIRIELGTARSDVASARADAARLQSALEVSRNETAAAREEAALLREDTAAAQQRYDIVWAAAQQLEQAMTAQHQAALRSADQARSSFNLQLAKAQQPQTARLRPN